MDGHYSFANMHALGVTNVLSAWVRPAVRHPTLTLRFQACLVQQSCSLLLLGAAGVLGSVHFGAVRSKGCLNRQLSN